MKLQHSPPLGRQVPGNTRHDALKARQAKVDIYPLTLFYDAACPLCHGEMSALMLRNTEGKLRFVDVSAPGFDQQPAGVTQEELLALIHAETAGGQIVRGVEVFRLAYEAAGLPAVSRVIGLPLLRQFAEWGYPLLARHRYRLPRRLVMRIFDRTVQRAAEQGAAARCDSATCPVPHAPPP